MLLSPPQASPQLPQPFFLDLTPEMLVKAPLIHFTTFSVLGVRAPGTSQKALTCPFPVSCTPPLPQKLRKPRMFRERMVEDPAGDRPRAPDPCRMLLWALALWFLWPILQISSHRPRNAGSRRHGRDWLPATTSWAEGSWAVSRVKSLHSALSYLCSGLFPSPTRKGWMIQLQWK